MIQPRPDNVAYYETMHLVNPALHTNNHGLLTRHRWFHMIEGCRRILEVGCGNGRLCEMLVGEYGKQVTGIDLAAGPYKRQGYDFQRLDVIGDELPRGFDAVLSFDVLEHMPPDKVWQVLAKIDDIAPICVFTIAGYALNTNSDHLTIKSAGWWLNAIQGAMARRGWRIQTFERYADKPSPVYLFMGRSL